MCWTREKTNHAARAPKSGSTNMQREGALASGPGAGARPRAQLPSAHTPLSSIHRMIDGGAGGGRGGVEDAWIARRTVDYADMNVGWNMDWNAGSRHSNGRHAGHVGRGMRVCGT